ncbi:MAG TPA: glycosyltransferase [Stellaceae bacterium]|nr:glycosyltransferase [Stellaceae bacterium]
MDAGNTPRERPARPLTICAVGAAASTHVATRVRWFAARGHRVFLITEAKSTQPIDGVTQLVPGADHPRAIVLLLHGFAWCFRWIGGDYLSRAAAFLLLLRRCRPDIVHVHYAYSFYGWIAGLAGCRPLVVTVMGGDVLFDEQGSPTRMGKWLTLHLLRTADYITSKSHHLTAVLDRLGGFAAKTERIVWGVSLAQFRRVDPGDLRSRLALALDDRVVLSPKILQPLYRVHLIVEAMPLVLAACPKALLLVTEYAADAEYKATIAARIASLGLGDRVRFCGNVLHADMPQYYSLAELAVAVPFSDGLPQTLLEAMACETPNVLSRLERYQEVVGHETSAYFVEATPSDIAAGILRLLRDDALCARIAGSARSVVKEIGNLDEEGARVEARYRALASSTRPRVFDPASLAAAWRSFAAFRAAQT